MEKIDKIGKIEAICLIVIIVLNHIILKAPKYIINLSGSASILNLIFITLIAFLVVIFICKVFKFFPEQDILDLSNFVGGKTLKNIVGILFISYFLFANSIFLRSFSESIKIIFFERTPVHLIILVFMIGIIFSNRLGLKSIVKANLIFMPIIIFTFLFIFFANIKDFSIQRIFPIFGNGLNTIFFSGLSNLFAFSNIALLYFLPPYLKDSKEFKKISLISIGLSSFFLLFGIATLLFIFSSLNYTNEILPEYLAARFIEFGRFFQRLDASLLLIGIICMMSYFNILTAFIVNIFTKLTNFKYKYLTIYFTRFNNFCN